MKPMTQLAIGFLLCLGLTGMPASAQKQDQSSAQVSPSGSSLGDYAKQVRKDGGTHAKPRSFDNDNLPKTDKLSIVGQPPAPESPETEQGAQASTGAKTAAESKPAAEQKAAEASKPKTPEEEEKARQALAKEWTDKLATQKNQIEMLTRELDVMQREYQLRAAAMYADAGNRLRNQAEWDKQDTQYKQQIADKQKAVDEAKQKLEDLREEARKAGAPASVREP